MPKTQFKIAFFELEQWEKEYLSKRLKNYKLQFIDSHLNENNANQAKDANAIGIFIYSAVNKKILDKLPNLKLIVTLSTGFDHIDLKECRKRKISACNVPHYGENTVAEHTFALILNLTRMIHKAYERTTKGDFSIEGLRGTDLQGKTLGVVGIGSIGQHVARIAKGFEMKAIAYDKFRNLKLAKRLGFKYASFDYLLKNSDIITVHVPYNKETHHLINKKSISKMKNGVLIINTARGGIIGTSALLEGLRSGKIGGAGLDVLEGECLIKEEKQILSKHFLKECDLKTVLQDHLLLKHPSVIITPHNAFNSWEALHRILDTTILNINSFLKKKPVNVVK
ncbi:hydroxyacid dehydrogenase [Candidatus Woesearchaeota archaeon]|nr:hydroxyacid dehydrogenase [Candidatus Woesearchaeota archaeon]